MLNLTDENFEKEIQNSEKPVLVDFWASWCSPCFILAPILEKVTQDYKEKIIFSKVNLEEAPAIAKKYKIEQIPTVVLFKKGKPISGFIGARPEPVVREWLGKSLEVVDKVMEKIEGLIKNYQDHAEKNRFRLNPDRKVVERLIIGMLENEKKYGEKYCPCRKITGDSKEDKPKICPCQWHRQEIEKDGHCFCGLFVK